MAVDFLNGLCDMSFSDNGAAISKELTEMLQNSDDMCAKIFDFTEGEAYPTSF